MAFKMKGYQAHGKSPMKIGNLWKNVTSKVKQAKDWVGEKTANMSNVVGLTGQAKKDYDAHNLAERKRYAKLKEQREKNRKYQEAKSKEKKGYASEYKAPKYDKEKYKSRQEYYDKVTNKESKLREEYAEKKYQEAKASRRNQPDIGPLAEGETRKEKKGTPYAKKDRWGRKIPGLAKAKKKRKKAEKKMKKAEDAIFYGNFAKAQKK